jgi:hypothetical protein
MRTSRTGIQKMTRQHAGPVSRACYLLPVLVVLAMPPTSAQAQRWENRGAAEVARLEAQCRTEAGRVFTGGNADEQRRAIGIARSCPDIGPEFIARRWLEPPTDSAVLQQLAFSSKNIIDARIAEAALETIRNRSYSLEIRLAALSTLVTQFNPSIHRRFGRILQDSILLLGTGKSVAGPPYVSTITGTPARPLTRGKSEMTPALRSRMLKSLRSFEQAGNDDPYLLLAVKGVVLSLSPPHLPDHHHRPLRGTKQ